MFNILHRARIKRQISGDLKPLIEASLAQCAQPRAVDWLAPQLLGGLHRLIDRNIDGTPGALGGRDREVVALRVYGELSGAADVFVSAALKVHRDGATPLFRTAGRAADRLHGAMTGRIDARDPAMRRLHDDAKALLTGPLSEAQRQALAVWPRRSGWHVAFLLWQRVITEPMAQARHGYGEPDANHPSRAVCEQINAALRTIGCNVKEAVPIVFAERAAVQTAAAILARDGIVLEMAGVTWRPEQGGAPARHDDRMIAGVLAFHIRRELRRRLDLDLEPRFPHPLTALFGDISQTEITALRHEVARAIAKLENRETGLAIEGAIGAWIDEPTASRFERLVRLHGALASHARLLKAA